MLGTDWATFQQKGNAVPAVQLTAWVEIVPEAFDAMRNRQGQSFRYRISWPSTLRYPDTGKAIAQGDVLLWDQFPGRPLEIHHPRTQNGISTAYFEGI